jgi:hypothetical protein
MKTQLIALVLGLTIPIALQAQSFRTRQYEQRQRITQGARSGELTKTEASWLYRRHTALNREYVRDRQDGRGLSPLERRKLDIQQNRLSRSIYRQKHDPQQR